MGNAVVLDRGSVLSRPAAVWLQHVAVSSQRCGRLPSLSFQPKAKLAVARAYLTQTQGPPSYCCAIMMATLTARVRIRKDILGFAPWSATIS